MAKKAVDTAKLSLPKAIDHEFLEVGQEMKILMLELRQFYVQRAMKGGASGGEHLLAYFNSYLYLLKRVLKLQGKDVPQRNEELVKVAAKQYELDVDFLRRMLE